MIPTRFATSAQTPNPKPQTPNKFGGREALKTVRRFNHEAVLSPTRTLVAKRVGINGRRGGCSNHTGGWHGMEPFGPLRMNARGGHLRISGVKRLSLLTFFGAAKKVSAAPHRGQGK